MESFKPFYQMHHYSNKKNNYAQFHCCVIIQNALLSNVDKLYRTHLIVCTIAKYFSVHETILLCRLTTIIFSTILIRPYNRNIFYFSSRGTMFLFITNVLVSLKCVVDSSVFTCDVIKNQTKKV